MSFSNRFIVLFFGLFFSAFLFGQSCTVIVSVSAKGSSEPLENVKISLLFGDSVLQSGHTNTEGKMKFVFYP